MHISSNFNSEKELNEKLDFIYMQSKLNKTFTGLMEVAFNEVTIITAVHNIKSNSGSKTPGTDRNTIDKYLQMSKEEVISLVKKSASNYKPKPARREYIPKSNGKKRPLGIPTVIDRIILECIRIVIEPICEAKFYPHSYGFRPYRACSHAIASIVHVISSTSKDIPHYVIEGDIKSYFDNINHKVLINKLWKMGVHDKRMLCLIKLMLKAGYIERDLFYLTEAGTPQGGIISPLLANVYLNSFDWMIGRMYQEPKGIETKNDRSHCREKLRRTGIKPKYLVRYADDWVILTTSRQEAERLLHYIRRYFKHKLKLELSEEKTVITDIKCEKVKFLGFDVLAELPRKTPSKPNPKKVVGKAIPNTEKVKQQVKDICREIKKLKAIPKDIDQAIQIEKINSKIVGVCEYWKSSICSKTFNYIDDKVRRSCMRVFPKLQSNWKEIKLNLLINRPERHAKYNGRTFAILVNDNQHIGITRANITASQWGKVFKQKMTPYSLEGRELYQTQNSKARKMALDRPPMYDTDILLINKNRVTYNFEYYMNREYAYNRDKYKCRCCSKSLHFGNRHCHHINTKLPQDKINKLTNLAWVCNECHNLIHHQGNIEHVDIKTRNKILKFRTKLYEYQVV